MYQLVVMIRLSVVNLNRIFHHNGFPVNISCYLTVNCFKTVNRFITDNEIVSKRLTESTL